MIRTCSIFLLYGVLISCSKQQGKVNPDDLWKTLITGKNAALKSDFKSPEILDALKKGLRLQSFSPASPIQILISYKGKESQTNRDIKTILKQHKIQLNFKEYDLFMSLFPSEESDSIPTYIIYSKNKRVLQELKSIPIYAYYQFFKNKKLLRFGYYESHFQFDTKRERSFHKKKIAETTQFRIYQVGSFTEEIPFRKTLRSFESSLHRIQSFFSSPLKEKLTIYLYSNFETKALETKKSHFSDINASKNEIYQVLLESDTPIASSFFKMIEKKAFPIRSKLIRDGLAVYFTENWMKKGFSFWAHRILKAGQQNRLSDFLNRKRLNYESPYYYKAQSASFVDFYIRRFGKTKFLRLTKRALQKEELDSLQGQWENFVLTEYSSQARNFAESKTFKKGFCFAHEGYRIYNGYLSLQAKLMLQKLKKLGINAVSITPFSFMRTKDKASPLAFSNWQGSENDESIIYSATIAKSLSMSVQMKPHIWLRNDWCGNIAMTSDAEWKLFFKNYTRWIRHYALMAEIYGWDELCLGVELSQTTLQREDDWRKLIADIRNIYSGKLSYAANWGREFEELDFWDDLDIISLNSYYPLSQSNKPKDEELKHSISKVFDILKSVQDRFNKPVYFTELGFTSSEKAWKNPHEDQFGKQVNQRNQSKLYRLFFEELEKRDVDGVFWWKWPTVLWHGGRKHPSFTPNNKSTEDIIKQFWGD